MDEYKPLILGRYVTYRIRWFVLSVVMLFNISNAMIWITYAPIANEASVYYHVTEDKINWFSLVFFFFSVICGLPAFWLIDTYGLRVGILTGTWMNAVGCIVRLLPSIFIKSGSRFWFALVGQVISACSQPLVLAMPTKLAAVWFAENERTVANTLASLSNPLGVLIASAAAPFLVTKPEDMKFLLIIFTVPAILVALMATFGVCYHAPPTAPSASAHLVQQPFLIGVKMVFKSRSFVILMFVFGFGVAAFSTVTSLLEQIICPYGYNNNIAGLCGALVIVGGLVFSGVASVYVDKTKKFEETAKMLALLLGLASCLQVIATTLYDQPVLLCITFFLSGGFALGVAPICLELGVECTYPVDEATSSGMQWLFGQLIGVFLMLGLPEIGEKLTSEQAKHSVCNVAGSDTNFEVKTLINALIFLTVLQVIITIVFVVMFKADYKRLHAEIESNASKILYRESPDDQEVNDFPTAY